MADSFSLEPIKMQMLVAAQELRECNDFTLQYGLRLSENQIQNIVEKRARALKDSGRVEFGEGILKKLIQAFADSPYISQDDYEFIIIDLQDAFYYFKNESEDKISDDELIEFMKRVFDEKAQGSLDFLFSLSLEELCRYTRYGYKPEDEDRPDQYE
ncbi:MAG: DUF6323 family protein [Oscillospiraceae bacterium]